REAFTALRTAPDLSLLGLYVHGREHEELYQLAEALIEWDERVSVWRVRHYKGVARGIGEEVVGAQGPPVELLGGLIKNKLYPELWQVRNDLTSLANEDQGCGRRRRARSGFLRREPRVRRASRASA